MSFRLVGYLSIDEVTAQLARLQIRRSMLDNYNPNEKLTWVLQIYADGVTIIKYYADSLQIDSRRIT